MPNESHPTKTQPEKTPKKDSPSLMNVWGLAGELGLIIATPVVVFVLFGIWLDKRLGTMPLFIIIGIILAMVTSTIAIVKKIKNLNLF